MIRPIEFLWRQLNGPQITAVVKAAYNWCVQQFDATMDYFNNLTIATANGAHLSLFGMMANFARPYIRVVDKTFFIFTEADTHPFDHGFSDLTNISVGGIFSDITKVWETERGIPLSDDFYRIVLQSYADSYGEIGSLALIDDLCFALKNYVGNENAGYDINILLEPATNRDIGDVFIDLGSQNNWNNWDSVVAALRALVDTSYAPLPRVWVGYTS